MMLFSGYQPKDRQSSLSSQLLKLRDDFQILGQLVLYKETAVSTSIVASTNSQASAFSSPGEGMFWIQGRFYYQSLTPFGDHYFLSMTSDMTSFLLQGLGLIISYLLMLAAGFAALMSIKKKKTADLHDQNFEVFNSTAEGLLVLQSDGQILKANQVFQDWLECDEEVLQKMNILHDPFSAQPMDLKQSLTQLLTSHEAFHIRLTLRFRYYKSYFLDATFYPETKSGDQTRYLVTLRDMTADSLRETELKQNASSLETENKTLLKQAFTDSLTGVYNRNYLNHLLEKKSLQWLAIEGCSILSMDLDHFKRINDDHGHAEGDRALQEFVKLMKIFFRKSDRIIRYGGDEFIVVLSRSDLKTAQKVAENFLEKHRENIRNIVPDSNLGVSIGVAELDPHERGDQWLHRADRALYAAKRKGRGVVQTDDLNQLEIIDA
jgi:diguanylate cyclase (GGDEF)-like protein